MKIKIDNRYIVESADKNISRDRFVDSVKKMSKVIEKVSNKDDVFEAEEDISNKYGTESIKRGDTVTGFQTKDGKKYIYLGIANRIPGDRRSDLAYPGVLMNKDTKEEIYIDSDIEDKLYSGDIKIDEVLSNKLYQKPEEWKRNYKPLLAKKEVKKEEVKEEKVEDAIDENVKYKLNKRKNEYGEFIVKAYTDGKYDEEKTYYTDDWEDAVDTLNAMAKQSNKKVIEKRKDVFETFDNEVKDTKKRGRKPSKVKIVKTVKDSKKSIKDVMVKISKFLDEFEPFSNSAKYIWSRINEEDKLDDLDSLLEIDYGYGDSIDDEELEDLLRDEGEDVLAELGIKYDADDIEEEEDDLSDIPEDAFDEIEDSCTKDDEKAFRFDINRHGKKYVVVVTERYDRKLDEPVHYVRIEDENGKVLDRLPIHGYDNAEQAAYYALYLFEDKRVDDSGKKKTNVADIPYNAPEKKSEFTYRKAVKGGSSAPTLASLKYAIEHDHDKERAELILRDIVKSSDEDVANPNKLKSVLGTPERKQLINEYAEAEDIARDLKLTDLADRLKENITKLGRTLKTGEWEKSFTNVPEEEIYRAGLKARKLYGKDSEYSTGYDVQFEVTPTRFNSDVVDYLNGVENNTLKLSITNVKKDARADYNRILRAEEDGDEDPYLDMYPTSVLKKIVKHYDNALAKLQNIKNEDGSLVFADDVKELNDYVSTIHKAWGI